MAGRYSDLLFAIALLSVAGPAMIVLAIAIAGTGQRPLFRQKRIGYGGVPFEILKLRTVWDEDARISGRSGARWQRAAFQRLAASLRSTGLDELPQIINVLKGDMRIIGPRPLLEADYLALPAGRERRVSVPPGLTGLAQVCGGQQLSPEEKLELDLAFMAQPRLPLLALILARSAARLVVGSRATRSGLPSWLAGGRQRTKVIEGLVDRAKCEPVQQIPQLVPGTVHPDPCLQTPAERQIAIRPVAVEIARM